MQGNVMFVRLFQRVVEQIIQGEDMDQVRGILGRPGIQPELRTSLLNLLQVFEQQKKLNESCLNDIRFYRSTIRRLEQGREISKQELDSEEMSSDKLQEVSRLVRKMSQIQANSVILPQKEAEQKKAKEREFEMQIRMSELERSLQQMEEQKSIERISSQTQIEKTKEQVIFLKAQIERLENNCENMGKMMEQLQNQKEEYEKMIKELNITLRLRDKEVLELKQMVNEKDVKIMELSGKNDQLKTQIQEIEEALCISNQNSQRDSQIFMDMQEQLNTSRLENQALKKIKESLDPILQEVQEVQEVKMQLHFQHSLSLKPDQSEAIVHALQAQLGQIKKLETLFRFRANKDNFHKYVDNRKNLLFVCLTESDQIVGAFTSAGVVHKSMKSEAQGTIAFLFQLQGDSVNTYKLKKGKKSTEYDEDFLLFGREELCLERGSQELSSYLMSGRRSEFHYEMSRQQSEGFLLGHHNDKVNLKDYELLRVQL